MAPIDWRAANRANWDERVRVHLGPGGYDFAALRAGRERLNSVTWEMFEALVEGADGLFRWPDKPWLPLSFSLRATRPS